MLPQIIRSAVSASPCPWVPSLKTFALLQSVVESYRLARGACLCRRGREWENMNPNTRTGTPKQTEANRRRIFFFSVLFFFLIILFFNYVTPMYSDDYYYARSSEEAAGFSDLIRQEYNQYITWTGRSVAHLTLRICFRLPRLVFKITNSLCFMLLSLLIYKLVDHKKRYDLVLYLLVQMSLWLFTVDFSQTVLWETGACNYLFCTTLVFAFLWRARSSYRAQTGSSRGKFGSSADAGLSNSSNGAGAPAAAFGKTAFADFASAGYRDALACVGLFLFGIIAGWCSENTSGACIVFVLLYLLQSLRTTHRATAKLIFAAAGSITGFLIMILAPGNRIRAAQTEASDPESYRGLAGMIARFQKVSLNMNREFFWLMAAFLVSAVILSLLALKRDGGKNRRGKVLWQTLRTSLLYFFLYGITCYALIMTQETQVRAYFGAGIFLILAVLQNLTDLLILEKEDGTQILGRTCVYGGLLVLLLHFLYVCMDSGTNCFRIYRDIRERENWIASQRDAGSQDITVAKVHPDFYNYYSPIAQMELEEDPTYWTNDAVEDYFSVEKIRAIDYDDWKAMTGQD